MKNDLLKENIWFLQFKVKCRKTIPSRNIFSWKTFPPNQNKKDISIKVIPICLSLGRQTNLVPVPVKGTRYPVETHQMHGFPTLQT